MCCISDYSRSFALPSILFLLETELQSGYTEYDPKNVCLKARDSRYRQITEEGQGQ